MSWKKRGNAYNITEFIQSNSLLTLEEVVYPKVISPSTIKELESAALMILKAIREGVHITIVGDYDVDGVSASAILDLLLKYFGVEPDIRLPKRYSEGYGLSQNVVEEIEEGIILTVDNGITAIEQIKQAKEKGLSVIVLDHHLPGKSLPEADVLVDPHISPKENGFSYYCGAGLAYKLAQLMVDDVEFLSEMCALAAIGTVADVMPLYSDNRNIVKDGLRSINRKKVPVGLAALLDAAELRFVDEKTIGFTIGPMLNAPGRLLDDGAMESLQVLIADNYEVAYQKAGELIELNNTRKKLTKEGVERAHIIMKTNRKEDTVPICHCDPELLSGLAGLVAGRLAEEYKVPAIVLTESSDKSLKGSARTYGKVHLKKMLDGACKYLTSYGGHEKAAGLSLRREDLLSFEKDLETYLEDYQRPSNEIFYDLEITQKDIPDILNDLKRYAPYGEGNPRPILRIDNIILLPQTGKVFKTMGEEKEHIRLLGKDISIIAFNQAEKYKKMGEPNRLNVIGYLSKGRYRGQERIEIEAIDFQSVKKEVQETELQKMMLLQMFQFIGDENEVTGNGGD